MVRQLLVVIMMLGLLARSCWLVMTAGPSFVLTRKPVPSPMSPLISTTARAWSTVRALAEADGAGAGAGVMAGCGGEEGALCNGDGGAPKEAAVADPAAALGAKA